MLFRQLFDHESYTYTYLLASGEEALLIDPVKGKTSYYLQLLSELQLTLKYTLDTHVHADHVTASGALQTQCNAQIVMGSKSKAKGVDCHLNDGEVLSMGDLSMKLIETPGHTDDSVCFLMDDRIFTGDTLFIRGTGRTDFQNGDPSQQYDSLFNKLLNLSDDILVYPGHDYNGCTASTIGEEKLYNPRLQVKDKPAYIQQMNSLDLPPPKRLEQAVPANLNCGI